MADSKITALTALTAADPANDMIPIVDVSDTPPASGNTKRISINNILACSPTATLASATITGDLTVDTSTLKVDSANNRVGINTASPAQSVDIASGNLQVRTGGTVFSDTFSNYGAALAINAAGSLPLRLQIGGTTAYEIGATNIHTWQNVGGVAGTAMALNSTGLGVGIIPIYKLHVKSDLSELYFRDNGTASELLINSETGGRSALYFGDVADTVRGGIVYDSATDSLDIRGYNNVARLQIDSVGNVVSNVTATAPTLSTNSQMVFNLTSNTNLRISVRGTDGVTRTANITLA